MRRRRGRDVRVYLPGDDDVKMLDRLALLVEDRPRLRLSILHDPAELEVYVLIIVCEGAEARRPLL